MRCPSLPSLYLTHSLSLGPWRDWERVPEIFEEEKKKSFYNEL